MTRGQALLQAACVEGGEFSARSDLASLGYVLIEMLSGAPPFEGKTSRGELLEAKRFLAQKLHGKPYTVVGDGKQTRDFTYVGDVASAFYAAAQSNLTNEFMNVGSSGHYSVNRLVELLGGSITYIPKRPGEPDCTFADVRKIREKLGWKASVSFEQGVEKILSRIDDFRDAPLWEPATIQEATKTWFKYLQN